MSSSVIRALKPVPATRARSTPSSRAKRRTEGLAWAVEKPLSLTLASFAPLAGAGTAAGAAAGAGVAFGAAGGGGAADAGTGAETAAWTGAAPAPSSTRTVATTSPGETVHPWWQVPCRRCPRPSKARPWSPSQSPASPSGPSTSMASPGLTSTSMTATSLKLPMSGTRTSMTRVTLFSLNVDQVFKGSAFAGSIPRAVMALPTVARSILPSSANALSVATTMKLRSTSKCRRRAARLSDRP